MKASTNLGGEFNELWETLDSTKPRMNQTLILLLHHDLIVIDK